MKSIEEITKEMQELFVKSSTEFALKMMQTQEEIIVAFMAKYQLQPDECVLCYQGNKLWVEKKEMTAK